MKGSEGSGEALGSGSSSRVQLKAWFHGVLVLRVLSSSSGSSSGLPSGTGTGIKMEQDMLQVLEKTLRFINQRFEGYLHALQTGGWEVDNAVLETGGSRRVFITSS